MDNSKHLEALAKLVRADQIVTDQAMLNAHDYLNRQYEKAFDVVMTVPPFAIVYAESTEDISKVMRYCDENGINLIARSGGSGAEGLLESREEGALMLDCSRMNKLIKLDPYNMMVTVQAGFSQEALELLVNKEGLTTGHSPQSRPLAQMGGLVATRSIGQFSTYYGAIEDMVCGLEAVMHDGEVVRIRPVPRRSAGPDLRHLFIGCEGGLGFITEITLKLFPHYPDDIWMGGYVVDSMDIGIECIRDIMAAGYKPAVVRVYDKTDYDRSFGHVELAEGQAYMFFTCEGPPEISRGTGAGVDRIAKKHGGQYIGTKGVERWLEHRNDICQKMLSPAWNEKMRSTHILDMTLEISASWSDIIPIYYDVMKNVPPKFENLVLLGGHVSHSYSNGTNIYFVYELKIDSPETSWAEQCEFINAICDEVIKQPTGGVVHHHGMGKQRVRYAKQEHGSSFRLMEELKQTFDPHDILNRGVLVPRYD